MCRFPGREYFGPVLTGTSGEHLAELPSREILKQLVERIDLMERVLGAITARLHVIEKHLVIVNQQQPLRETLAGVNRQTHPATPQIKTEDVKAATPTHPPIQQPVQPVSYTHLTLPTSDLV